MSDTVTERQVTNKVTAALANHRGLFIGETHNDLLAAYFTISHMRELKEAGVTTVYVEYNALKARAAQGGERCRAEFMGPSSTDAGQEADSQRIGMQMVIEAATLAGMRVIGHDPLTSNSWQWDKIDADPSLLHRLATNGSAIDRRDDYAAEIINRTYDGGKFIVYGGLLHSGNEVADRPSKKGLSERLKIPSIDFTKHEATYHSRRNAWDKMGDAFSDLANALSGQKSPLHMRSGVGGESTWKVFAFDERAALPPGVDDPFVGLDTSKLARIQSDIRASGVCSLPPTKAYRDAVPLQEALNFINGTNQPTGTRRY